jgi:hypothetical protein
MDVNMFPKQIKTQTNTKHKQTTQPTQTTNKKTTNKNTKQTNKRYLRNLKL